jgi:glutamine amidotransferase
MVSLLNCGIGNISSVYECLNDLGITVKMVNTSEDINPDSALVICGVGSFDECVIRLQQINLWHTIQEIVRTERQKVLGICLGMQILTLSSEEGKQPGIGYFPVKVRKLKAQKGLPVPHIGWNKIQGKVKIPGLTLSETDRFYFSHQYAVIDTCVNTVGHTTYGESFSSILFKGKTLGVQFHPEKSYVAGKQLLSQFLLSEV